MTAARPRTTRRRRSVAIAIATALTMLATSGCLIGIRAGQRCRTTDFGNDGTWVLQCRKGRWTRLVTTQQLAQFALAAAAPPTGPPLRVIVGGDSTGTVMANAFARYAAFRPGMIEVVDVSMLGCPVTTSEAIRNYDGEGGQSTTHCGLWSVNVPAKVQQHQPEVALVFFSMMEQSDQRLSSNDPWRNVLDPEWAAYQRTNYHRYVDAISATGAHVLWADVPFMQFWMRTLPWIADSPARTSALNASYRQFASERTDVELLPVASRLDRPFGAIDKSMRPDGIHLSETAANAEVANWLVPMLLQRYRGAA